MPIYEGKASYVSCRLTAPEARGSTIASSASNPPSTEMPRKDIESAIRKSVDNLVAELTELLRESALETVREALANELVPMPRSAGRPRKSAGKAGGSAKKSGKRVRRTIEDLEAYADRIHNYVQSHPGVGVVAISKGVRLTTKDVKRPIQMLLAAKRLRTEGQKRGTTYFTGKKAKKKARKA